MDRRKFLQVLAAIPLLSKIGRAETSAPLRRVRPGDAGWPTEAKWQKLNKAVGGRLIKIESPLAACKSSPVVCEQLFKDLKNPYYIGDHPALTQTSGYADAWASQPSVYAIAAEKTQDVVAAINFARENKLRLVVKGGGHSYQGTSNAPDSLLVWTRRMNKVTLHDAFVGKGCQGKQKPQPAVTVQSGAMWMHTYNEVTTKGGRYVQGGGCATVGAAGLIQSGGFGTFSKRYGLGAAGLVEAEIVTADGRIRIANACSEPELFWGIKGGGGGSLGVVTSLTLRTRELPEFFGGMVGSIKATSDDAFRRLIAKFFEFYHERLLNPHWGEQVAFRGDNVATFQLVFQGLTTEQARTIWQPFTEWLRSAPKDFVEEQTVQLLAFPARHFWDAQFLKKNVPFLVISDNRPVAPDGNIYWAGNQQEAGQFLHGYRSAWLPVSLLEKGNQKRFVDAMFASTRHWGTSLHFNKGLAGAPAEEIVAARDTATNPAVLDAFALAITGSEGPPAFAGIAGHEPALVTARARALRVGKAMDELLKAAPYAGSYLAESDFFEKNWQRSFWGSNYERLAAVKKKYDPEGLFFVHHGVGSEVWSPDGFTRLTPSN